MRIFNLINNLADIIILVLNIIHICDKWLNYINWGFIILYPMV